MDLASYSLGVLLGLALLVGIVAIFDRGRGR